MSGTETHETSIDEVLAQLRRVGREIAPGSRKEAILRAAEETFAERGFQGASLNEIAQVAGVSKSGLLHHYPSKGELLVAVLEWVDALEAEEIGVSALAGAIDMLHAQVALLRTSMTNPSLMRFTILMACEGTSVDHPAHLWARRRCAFLERAYAEAFVRDVDHGRIVLRCEPCTAARQLVAMMDGLKLQWLLSPDDVDPAAVLEQYVNDWSAMARP